MGDPPGTREIPWNGGQIGAWVLLLFIIIVVWRVRRVDKSVDAHLTGRMVPLILLGADHWSSLTCAFVSLSLSCAPSLFGSYSTP